MLSRHEFRAERPQERTVPLRVDRAAACQGTSRGQVGYRYSRGIGAPVEHRIPAERASYADSECAANEVTALPYLDAVRPPPLVERN
jgi:hypothetical protein